MKTEKEYANELIERYLRYTPVEFEHEYTIKCAIIDVENTIKALTTAVNLEYSSTKIDIGQSYYQTVLQILKERL